MRIKSYFAESVQNAMERAREELGADAMLVHSKHTEPELRQLGRYEVVFGIANAEARPPERVEPKQRESREAKTAADPVLNELWDLKKELEVIRRSITRQNAGTAMRRSPADVEDLIARLERSGFSGEFAEEIAGSAEAALRAETDRGVRQLHSLSEIGFSRDAMENAVIAELERRIRVSPEMGASSASSRPIMLVGPPGAGKTSVLVKLALQYGVRARTPLAIFTTDVYRVGAWEQLSRYARIAGAPFESFQNVNALAAALEKRTAGRLVLIDTPGYSAAEMNEALEWAEYAQQSRMEVHLVLPATLRTRVALDIAERFTLFGCSNLILTNCDELDTPASACELAAKIELPLSFISNGQQIPEDLRAASAAELARQAVPRLKSAAVSAA